MKSTEEYVRELVAQAPPLSQAQKDTLRILLTTREGS